MSPPYICAKLLCIHARMYACLTRMNGKRAGSHASHVSICMYCRETGFYEAGFALIQ